MSPRTKLCLIGLATAAVGLVPVLASFDVIASDDDDFGAPRWVVAAIGLCFVLAGVWLALTRAPDGPLTGLLRAVSASLLQALAAGFCVAVVVWFRRVGAGPLTRTAFVTLAVVFALLAAHGLWRAVAALGRHPRP